MTLGISIFTTPIPKGRPRFYGNHAVTPPKTREYEKLIREQWTHGMMNGPLHVTTVFTFKVPKSYSKKKHAELIGMPKTTKPDLDNLVKAVLDALNGVAYEDDSNICGTVALKKYGEEDEVFIMIEEVGKEDG